MRPALLITSALLLTGCTVTAMAPTEADESRARAAKLEREASELRARVQELEMALAAATRSGAVSDEVLASAPFATEVAIGRHTALVDIAASGRFQLLRVYVEPRDARGTVVQVAGTISIEATWVVDGEARVVTSASLTPAETRAAFRGGFLGAFYLVELPVDLEQNPAASCLVRVRVDDGFTGRELRAERSVDVARQIELARPRVTGGVTSGPTAGP